MTARSLLGVGSAVLWLLFGCDAAPVSPANTTAETSPGDSELRFDSSHGSRVAAANRSGIGLVINMSGGPVVDPSNPFFQSLGTNGRSCGTCHEAETGMTLTPDRARLRFLVSAGTEPLFRTNDGSVSPLADVSTVRARA